MLPFELPREKLARRAPLLLTLHEPAPARDGYYDREIALTLVLMDDMGGSKTTGLTEQEALDLATALTYYATLEDE